MGFMGLTRKSFALCVGNGRFTKVSRSRGRVFWFTYHPWPLAMRWQLSKHSRAIYREIFTLGYLYTVTPPFILPITRNVPQSECKIRVLFLFDRILRYMI